MLRLSRRLNTASTFAATFSALAFGLSAIVLWPTVSRAEQANSGAATSVTASDDLNAVFKAQPCLKSKSLAQLDAPIARVAKRLDAHTPVTIVAVGSSSTGGSGASSPAYSYPSRLERELRQRFPGAPITVLNRGVNGEDAADMMARMDEILGVKPDLVIWQLGTNTLLRDGSIPATGELLQAGISRIRKAGADVLLIDPQFAPRVNAKPAVNDMVGLIAYVAKQAHVPLFRRYVAMRHWHEDEAIAFDRFITADGLHMNDWGYSCLARLLADNIATTVSRSRAVADVQPPQ
ncbi:SGNH/GDSL hydrolase family protein [Bradyrhizobium sp. G127]|jgi:lysophospholipase L1-like esterase|uniref:SGNH/GDSL hydrolase family protein n=1 Tax=Bradyrhizobium sp. G127 TaxID=2904800 RepID=UPI001F21D8B8|nr:SGNH/GDSL hydrolase family protein [Bradyrhizobium sp. G127]MCF2523537.1 SGNH/GDSL hydrolase family protein [Bradyrhizobium sp. G127]